MISRKFLSIKWYKDVLIFFLRVKFHFKNPPKNKLIIFDKESIDDLYEIFKDYKYFILENRLNHMNNFYFNFKILKLIIYFYRGNFMTAYLKSMISIINPENVITLDGVRAKNEMGWWLIRASNTEEAIVVRFEGKSEKDQDKLLIEVKERLKNEGLTWEYS